MSLMTGRQDSVEIRSASSDDLIIVAPLWAALYEHQMDNGMLLDIPADAYEKWEESIRPLLGRFACLFLAENDGNTIGFLAARIRLIPPYFGGGQAGFISEVYVDDRYRSLGVGKRLMERTTEWFRANGIDRMELQVIANNVRAREFYIRHGWREELVQMVRQTDPK